MADTAADTEIEDSELSSIIAREIQSSITFDQTELSKKRASAVKYMRGDMSDDLPARVNGSSQTSRDVSDTISWILPGVVRVFAASDKMVTYSQVEEEDDRWSEEATEYTNYSFWTENDGYRVLYNTTYDGLVMGNGVVCSYWEPPKTETKIFRDKVVEEIAQLKEDGWSDIISAKEGKPRSVSIDDPASDGEPQEIQLPTITVKLSRTTKKGRVCDDTCKPENLFLNSTATTIDDARFVAYLYDNKTRSDLMQMAKDYGWDSDVIAELPSHAPIRTSQVAEARFADISINARSSVRSGDPINLYVVYIKADMDGDGIAEMIEAWCAGDDGGNVTVLGWEEWEDEVPFTDVPCYPVPHRWDAESVYDRTADIQRVKTTMLRQGIENMYAANQPLREIEEGSVLNPDILINPKFNGLIWKKKGSAPIVNYEVPSIIDKVFMGLQYMDEQITKRTGVSRSTMALDPEALQNQTATANQNLHDAGYSQIELIARNMAELGWKAFFRKRLKIAIKHEQVRKIPSSQGDSPQADSQPPQMGPDGQPMPPKPSKFRQISPSQWDPNMAVSINVGLGTGSRDRDMAMLKVVKDDQMMMASQMTQAGFGQKAVEFIPKIRATAVKMAEASGLKNPDEYYPEISDDELAQMKQQAGQGPAPDPRIAADLQHTQLKIQGEQASQQSDAQIATIKAQAETTKAQLEGQVGALKLQMAQKEAQEQDIIAGLKLQLDKAVADGKNNTALQLKAMDIQGQIMVARVGAGHDIETLAFSKYLDALIGEREHEQALELQDAKPEPKPNGAAQ